jgi:hypothetical protein
MQAALFRLKDQAASVAERRKKNPGVTGVTGDFLFSKYLITGDTGNFGPKK